MITISQLRQGWQGVSCQKEAAIDFYTPLCSSDGVEYHSSEALCSLVSKRLFNCSGLRVSLLEGKQYLYGK